MNKCEKKDRLCLKFFSMGCQKILIAVDDSSHSMKADRAGFAMAHRLKAAK
jgi:hypothetical protein